jgi:hypothetical protein
MGTRLRLLVILLGALLVAATWTYPLWQPYFATESEATEGFPGLAEELQPAFLALPGSIQRQFLSMYNQNPSMATEIVTARLNPDVEAMVVQPPLDTAVEVRQGEFTEFDLEDLVDAGMVDEDILEDPPPYRALFGAEGDVIIYLYPDNRKLLWFNDFRVINGPDLHVAISTSEAPLTFADIEQNYRDLGPLVANVGDQGYDIPVEEDITLYNTVVIFSRQYGFIYAVAPI